jgi:excisionase family DNA binding protein
MIQDTTQKNEWPMSLPEAAHFLHLSVSTLYKMTAGKLIGHFKPGGKKIYFFKDDLDEWLCRNRRGTL